MSPTTLAPVDTGPDDEAVAAGRFVVHRPPRRYPEPLPAGEVVIAPPPPRLQATGGWLVALLPALGSGGSLLLLGASGRRRWLLLAVAASLLLSLAAAAVPPLRRRRAVRRTRDRYLDHLDAVAGTLARAVAVQRAAAGHLFPDLPGLLAIAGGGERLWERRPADEDFLAVRVGRWTAPLAVPVRLDLGPDPLVERDPTLLAAARDLLRRASRLEALPLVVPLRRAGVVALTGPRAPALDLARFLLVQVAVFHAPGDVRVLVACPAADARDWDWLKWLPHVRDGAGGPGTTAPRCLLASTAEQLAAHLEREVRPRLDPGARAGSGGGAIAHDPPTSAGPAHLLVVLDGFSPRGPLGRPAVLDEVLRCAADLEVTVLCLAARRADEPSELRLRIELDGAGGIVAEEAGPRGSVRRARGDAAGIRHCEAIARRLAPLRPAGQPDPGGVPSGAPVRLLELLGLDGPAALDPAGAWRSRPWSGLLRVPIGLAGEHGARTPHPLILDLKQAAEGGMGPHGMLIGATGSGKSELLRTIVTGLAVTHPPELLSFVLVDFKGGAAFAGLEALPHTAGLITNLQADPALVDRALAALRGELERRQRVLRQAGNLEDIGRYQSCRAADPALGPLPYLLLVVDEFGELLAARPEFLDLFIAVGRIGRSLGIHLLLASQRLDEGRIRGLESHLRYRICLRTFAAADSVAVLGTAVAHTLPPHPGRGWLQVDGDTLPFEGATVSVGAAGGRRRPRAAAVVPFEPAASGATGLSSSAADQRAVRPITEPGQRWDAGTDMAGVAAALARAVTPGRRADQVWLPPLPTTITLGAVLARVAGDTGTAPRPGTGAWLRVPVGLVDRPREQVQEPFLLDLAGAGGHLAVVGAPGSGKSTLLATIAAAFALTHAPDAVQLYCIDLGGGLLRRLAGLPHVGAVCGPGERDEARYLVRELRALLAARERAPHALAAGPDGHGGAQVLLLVDNWARLREELADLEPEIEALAAAGLHHGVHLVVSANRWADLRLALRDNLGGRLELRLNDPLESALGRAAGAALPADTPGRGLTPTGLQFQAAIPTISASPHDAGTAGQRVSGAHWFATAAGEIRGRAVRSPGGVVAPPLRMLPAVVHAADLPDDTDGPPGAIPLGLHERQLAPVWLDLLSGPPHFLVLGDAECGKTSVLRCLAAGLGALPPHRPRLTVIDYRRGLADLACLPHCGAYACTPAGAVAAVAGVHRAVERRSSPREPSAPRGWSGPHHVLLVDDYHLLTGGGGNPLEALLDLVALGGDVGLHVVLACAAGGAARAAFDPFLRRLHELGSPGLVMSGDPADGPLLGGRPAVQQPPGRGLLIRRRGSAGLVQVAWVPAPLRLTGTPGSPDQ